MILSERGNFIKTHLNLSPMITLDQLGESYVLNLHISYIQNNAYFKFGGIGGVSLCF